jgi:hypothetical protein
MGFDKLRSLYEEAGIKLGTEGKMSVNGFEDQGKPVGVMLLESGVRGFPVRNNQWTST